MFSFCLGYKLLYNLSQFVSSWLDVRILKVFSVWPICIFSGLLPISISGIGTRESAFIFLWTDSFKSSLNEQLFVASFLYTVNVYWLLGLFSIMTLGIIKLRKHTEKKTIYFK